MDSFVFDAHQNGPERIVPVDGHRQGHRLDDVVNDRTHCVAIGLDLVKRRPVVMRVVEIVPGHLIDADGKHGFEPGIDSPGHDLGNDELIDVESRRVPDIENQRVPERFSRQVKSLLRSQSLVKLLVKAIGLVEVPSYFLSFVLGCTLIENRCSGVSQVHGVLHNAIDPNRDGAGNLVRPRHQAGPSYGILRCLLSPRKPRAFWSRSSAGLICIEHRDRWACCRCEFA